MLHFLRKPYRSNEIYECLAKHLGVKYIYEGYSEESDDKLTHEMFANLPEALLDEFKEALESLDTENIDAVIEQIAQYDAELQKTLQHLADNFDYSAILKALK